MRARQKGGWGIQQRKAVEKRAWKAAGMSPEGAISSLSPFPEWGGKCPSCIPAKPSRGYFYSWPGMAIPGLCQSPGSAPGSSSGEQWKRLGAAGGTLRAQGGLRCDPAPGAPLPAWEGSLHIPALLLCPWLGWKRTIPGPCVCCRAFPKAEPASPRHLISCSRCPHPLSGLEGNVWI